MLEALAAGTGRPMYIGYLTGFVLASAACLGAAWRAREVPYADTRRGLMGFFLGSGAWAATYVGFLLSNSALGKNLFYQASLIVGFGTVWAWLWFCSAYSGRALHRYPSVRRFAAAVFAVVTALKITNPLHGLYYELEPSGGAFGLVVTHGTLYWVVMALAYALASAGYLMLFELFLKTGAQTGPLMALTGLTALPAVLNVIGHLDASLLDVTHEPLGVAVFAVGVLFAYTYQFNAVRVAGGLDGPNLMIGPSRQIRDFGGGAAEAIPQLTRSSVGKPLSAVLPGLSETLREGRSVWETERDSRYFRITETTLEGTVGSRVIVFSDITEQVQRRRRLERRNDLFEKAQELADVGAWEYDVQESALTWTDQVYTIYGLAENVTPTIERAIGQFHREDRSRIEEVFDRAVEKGVPYDEELRIRRPDGEVRWVRAYGEPQKEEGTVVRVRGAFRDITERKRREETLQKLREKYQGLLEGAPNAIFVADVDTGTIIEANQKAASLIGTTVGEIVGRDQSDIHPSGDAEKYRSLFKRSMQGAEKRAKVVSQLEDGSQTFVETDSGEEIPVEISAKLVELEDEKVFVGIFRDITEQKQRERALRKAKEEAEEAARLKSSMLANMSHEIRTPLTSIIGFSEAIGDQVEALGEHPGEADLSRLSRFAELIEKGGTRLLETLDGVLNLSKLESGQMEIGREPVDVAAQAAEIAEELRPRAEEKGLSLQLQASGEDPPRALADEGGVQIVLRNLVSNAIKYTEEGGVVLRVRSSGKAVVLEVEDSGIGMQPEMAEVLFEPFRQASEGLGREYEGTGIGLAVTKEAAEQMGGSIDVTTEKGNGSCFTVSLPAAEREGLAPEDVETTAPPAVKDATAAG